MSDLKRIVKLGELLAKQKATVEELEGELKAAKAAMLRTEREDLPQLMVEVGLTEVRLEDGTLVRLEEDCDTRITDRTRDRALTWLLQNGFGGLIKTEVAVRFGRGEHDRAVEASDMLAQNYDAVETRETVHHSTLKAFVKEQMASGNAIPMDLFNVHPYQKATIKRK